MLHTYVNWNSRSDDDDIKWRDDETAPLGTGPIGPIPTIDNPND